jgi:hypothetical protein
MKLKGREAGLAATWWMIGVLAVAALLFALYVWIMLSWSYSDGERAGWVQKLSRKGYICKTWEGEMAMVSMPGAVPEKFQFTVWDKQTADAISAALGKRVSLHYEEHMGLPTSCFGDTRHFITAVKVLEEGTAPMVVPGANAASPPGRPLQPQAGRPAEAVEPTQPEAAGAPAGRQ